MAAILSRIILRTAVLGAFALLPAFSASLSVYGNADQANFFSTLVQDVITIDFDNQITSGGWRGDYSSAGYTIGDVQIVGHGTGDYYTALIWPNNNVKDWGTKGMIEGTSYINGEPDRRLHIELPVATTAVGLNLMTWALNAGLYTTGADVSVTLSTSDVINPIHTAYWASGTGTQSPALAGLSPAWLGITSDTPFSWIDIRPLSGTILLDNLSYGTAVVNTTPTDPPPPDVSETPEAGTMILIGTGLFGLRFVKRSFGSGNPA